MTTHAPCTAGARCRSCTPGHLMHSIQVTLVRQAPEGWRDAVVRSIDEHNVAVVEYATGEGACTLWHHHDLSVMCPPGTAVMVHERWHVLAVARVVVNVHVHDGVGPVAPTPARYLPAGIVTELATGHGVMGS
ncbi:hypothetical protein SAMN05216184_101288 [Georgenia satyanarayanai]|uniref:Uncharacterized protein n=1 Tax=Georgenia satyanarayanai TaxID=860221 RepID=A0A2Y8ZXC6_9MICO|nr:hypothetical protein [Georgenia satyanarayanai]PYG01824.1 hypothetical protein A8987_101288 [Georgenia satyanarayanai]SSA36625.1 hypothetical protein SAMN05216184_101288 [Georgenia satyanarayanai]